MEVEIYFLQTGIREHRKASMPLPSPPLSLLVTSFFLNIGESVCCFIYSLRYDFFVTHISDNIE